MTANPVDLAREHLSGQRIARQVNTARREKEALRNPSAVRYQGFNAAQGQPITSSGMGGKIKTNGAIEQNTQLRKTGSHFSQMPHKPKSFVDTTTYTQTGRVKSLFSQVNEGRIEFFIGSDRPKPKKIFELGETQIILAAQLENTGRGKNNFEAGILVQDGNDYKLYLFKGGSKKELVFARNEWDKPAKINGKFWQARKIDIITDIKEYNNYDSYEEENRQTTLKLISFNTEKIAIQQEYYKRVSEREATLNLYREAFTLERNGVFPIFISKDSVTNNIDNFTIDYQYSSTPDPNPIVTESALGVGVRDFPIQARFWDINGQNPIILNTPSQSGTYDLPINYAFYLTLYPNNNDDNLYCYFDEQEIPYFNPQKKSGNYIYRQNKLSFYKVSNYKSNKKHFISAHELSIGDSEWQDQDFEAFAYPIPDNVTIYDRRFHP